MNSFYEKDIKSLFGHFDTANYNFSSRPSVTLTIIRMLPLTITALSFKSKKKTLFFCFRETY